MESKLRILISDDDKEFCSRCTAILRGCGFETTIAPRDGHLILEMIRDYQPDVVLMDIFMPYQDAIGVISQVRESWKYREVCPQKGQDHHRHQSGFP